MRYMMLVRSVASAGPPPSAFPEAMGKLSAQDRESGMLIAGGPHKGRCTTVSQNPSAPAPLVSAQMFDFGNTIVMTCLHQPYHGKPVHVTRVWLKRNGQWLMAIS